MNTINEDYNLCSGSVSFSCLVDNMHIENFSIQNITKKICNVLIKTNNGALTINAEYRCSDNITDCEINYEIRTVCEHVLDILSLILKVSIPKTHCTGSSRKRPGKLTQVAGEIRAIHSLEEAPVELTDNAGTQIKNIISNNIPSKNYHLVLWREAQNRSDIVSKFLILYSILIDLCDNQKDVDSFIRRISPNTIFTKSPVNSKYNESQYTRIRNELSHRRDGVDINTTITELTPCMADFEQIVKKILLEELTH